MYPSNNSYFLEFRLLLLNVASECFRDQQRKNKCRISMYLHWFTFSFDFTPTYSFIRTSTRITAIKFLNKNKTTKSDEIKCPTKFKEKKFSNQIKIRSENVFHNKDTACNKMRKIYNKFFGKVISNFRKKFKNSKNLASIHIYSIIRTISHKISIIDVMFHNTATKKYYTSTV